MAKIITKSGQFSGHIGPVAFVKGEGETDIPTALAYFRRHADRYDVIEDEKPEHDEQAEAERLAAEQAEADRIAAEQEAAQAAEAARLEAEAAEAAKAEQVEKPKRQRRKPAEKADDNQE